MTSVGLCSISEGSGGGLLHAAAEVSDMFINTGRIVADTRPGRKSRRQF